MRYLGFIVAFLLALACITSAPLALATAPGTYSVDATAQVANPGNLTIQSNGGTILSVHIAGKVKDTDYEVVQQPGSSEVTIVWLTGIAKGETVTVSGSCAVSGSHTGAVKNPSDSTWK